MNKNLQLIFNLITNIHTGCILELFQNMSCEKLIYSALKYKARIKVIFRHFKWLFTLNSSSFKKSAQISEYYYRLINFLSAKNFNLLIDIFKFKILCINLFKKFRGDLNNFWKEILFFIYLIQISVLVNCHHISSLIRSILKHLTLWIHKLDISNWVLFYYIL